MYMTEFLLRHEKANQCEQVFARYTDLSQVEEITLAEITAYRERHPEFTDGNIMVMTAILPSYCIN